jgi:DNA-binding GntR family transcriptional regulator
MRENPRSSRSAVGDASPVIVKSLSEVITETLREGILAGEFPEGEFLRQQILANRYGVSEGVIREALLRLETEGLVVVERRRGARVSQLSIEEIKEIYELRILLEEMLARHAAHRISSNDLSEAARLLKVMDQEHDPVQWLEHNREFHNILYRAGRGPRFLRFANDLRVMVERYLRLSLAVVHTLSVGQEEHREILEAFRAHDPERASRAVAAHLKGTRDRIASFLASRPRGVRGTGDVGC